MLYIMELALELDRTSQLWQVQLRIYEPFLNPHFGQKSWRLFKCIGEVISLGKAYWSPERKNGFS